MHEDLELGRTSDVSRTTHLDDAQEALLLNKIEEYRKQGGDGWGYLSPCSTFAADSWETATGEHLDHRKGGVISNPSTLKDSISAANAKGKVGIPAAAPTGSSATG